MASIDIRDLNDSGVVRGLQSQGIYPRQDIDVLLYNEPDTFNLFLLALQDLQEKTPWQDKMSFYQIAGIHGLPNEPWDKARGKMILQNKNASGYCAHGNQTFPTWHRPYLAMLEQSLYGKMLSIAEKYTNPAKKAVYLEAVKKFRFPYWDYHRPRDYNAHFPGVKNRNGTTFFPYDFRVPQILTLKSVKVKMWPNEEIKEIPNPLSRFKFPDGAMSDSDWNVADINAQSIRRKETVRWPGFTIPVDSLNGAINEQREDTIRLSLNFIENGAYDDYKTYATAGTSFTDDFDGKTASGSLESVHGMYHGSIGWGGHMGSVTTAAFDPIFWLHHCQIDRWFAIWKAAHPGSWFAPPDKSPRGDKTTPIDPLLPFRSKDQTTFWNSDQSYDTKVFGYTYPDLQGHTKPAEVQGRFKNLYSWARRLTAKPNPDVKPPPEMTPLDLSTSPFFQGVQGFKPLNKPVEAAVLSAPPPAPQAVFALLAPSQPETFAVKAEAVPQAEAAPAVSTDPKAEIHEDKVSREWYIDDVVQRLALNTSFTILYLIGQASDNNPMNLILAPAFAGLNHVFAAPIEACDNCGQQDEQAHLVTSTVPITSLLLDYVQTGELESMRPEHVKPFLVKNLKWRVVKVDGTRVDPRQLSQHKDFKISVSCKVAPLPGEQGAVVYETFPDISTDIIRNAD